MGNLENGPDIERFGEDFARDVRNADALREKLQKESKDEINQYNKEQTERIKIEHQKEIEQSIASFEALASNDWEKHFPTGNYIGSKRSEDGRFALVEDVPRSGYHTLRLFCKSNGQVQLRDFKEIDKATKLINDDRELLSKLQAGTDYKLSMTNESIPEIRFEYMAPILEGSELVLHYDVLTQGGTKLYSEEKRIDVETLTKNNYPIR
ncbi:hypothetical protein KAZ66_03735 [Candidatus Woesebacteria bacterium]|nr:hypothetical protein [Candidatus Woesebacteria bacterium]